MESRSAQHSSFAVCCPYQMHCSSSDDEEERFVLCQCTSYGCKHSTVTQGGQSRCMLSQAMVERHQVQDLKNEARWSYTVLAESQATAVQKDQETKAELYSQFHISSPPSPTARKNSASPPTFKEVRARCLDVYSKAKDRVDELKATVSDLPDPHALEQLQLLGSLQLLNNYHCKHDAVSRKIDLLKSQHAAKFIRTQLDQLDAELSECSRRISDAKLSYGQVIKERSHPTTGAPIYDTSKCQRLCKFPANDQVYAAHHHQSILSGTNAAVALAQYMVVVMNVILMFPRHGCSWLLSMGCLIVQSTMEHMPLGTNISMSQTDQDLLSRFPPDTSTAVSAFRLDSKYVIYAACPKCHHIYEPNSDDPETPFPTYPKQCRYRQFERGKPCNTLLLRPTTHGNAARNIPIKPFISFDFNDWLGGLLAKPGNEKKLDASWEGVAEPRDSKLSLKDIFDGSLVREFKGPDGEKHFSIPLEEGEGHYIFGCGFDKFNPLTNKQAGKKISIGVMMLVCFNLPLSK